MYEHLGTMSKILTSRRSFRNVKDTNWEIVFTFRGVHISGVFTIRGFTVGPYKLTFSELTLQPKSGTVMTYRWNQMVFQE